MYLDEQAAMAPIIDEEQPASPIYNNCMEVKQNNIASSLEPQTTDENENQSTVNQDL